jgi:hypothetical protein
MSMEINVTISLALAAGTALVSVATAWAITKRAAEEALRKAEAAEAHAARVERDLGEFKVEAARRFVTDEMLTKVEERVVEAINRLGDRLDRLLDAHNPRRPS